MKETIIVLSIIAILTLLTSGCTSYPQKPLNPEVRLGMKKIGLLNFENPKNYDFYYTSRSAMGIGGLAMMIHKAKCDSVAKDISEAFKSQDFDYATEVKALLIDSLTENGYDIHMIDVERRNSRELVKNYKKIDPKVAVDVYMDFCGMFVGYSSYCKEDFTEKIFAPHLGIVVRLIDPVSGEMLYAENYVHAGCYKEKGNYIRTHPSEKYVFQGLETLSQDPPLLTEGLREGLVAVAEAIGRELK